MSIKKTIAKSDYDSLDDAIKKLYVADGDKYRLDLEEKKDDSSELKRALERERQNGKDLKKTLEELKTKLEDESTLAARKAGDIETLEKSWSAKLEKAQKEFQKSLEDKNQFLRKMLVDNVALQIATEIAGPNAEILIPHLKSRLQADLDSSIPMTRVLDGTGNISSLSPTELGQEFVANPKFAAIVVGSKASGSGASDSGKGKRNGVTFDAKLTTDLSKLDSKTLGQFVKSKVSGNQM